MRYFLLSSILIAFIGGILNYGKNYYQPKNVSVSFRSEASSQGGKVELEKGKIGGGLDRVRDNRTATANKTKRLPPAVLAAETHTPTALVEENQVSVATKVRTVFSEEPEIAVAVFRAESGLRPGAQGWNCYYNGVSRACLPEDRENAWSVDCGVAQLNFAGKVCPAEAFDVDWNLQQAKGKYVRRAWQPWSAYNNGSYQKFLQ